MDKGQRKKLKGFFEFIKPEMKIKIGQGNSSVMNGRKKA
jgi:hypothetical protein